MTHAQSPLHIHVYTIVTQFGKTTLVAAHDHLEQMLTFQYPVIQPFYTEPN